MPEYTIRSNEQALFVGPSPSSGYHFVNSYGDLTGSSDGTHNLIKQLNGLTQFEYNINTQRQDISELGRRELVSRPQITPPLVDLSFQYMAYDLRNEMRMGFNPNFPTGFQYKQPYYEHNTGVFCFKGFTSRETTQAYPEGGNWPFEDRDRRNLFFVNGKRGMDLRNLPENEFNEISTLAFGDCYINSYSTEFNIQDLVRSSVSYVCHNVNFYNSGSGIIPSVDTTGFNNINDNIFKIPILRGEASGSHITGARKPLLTTDLDLVIQATGYGEDRSDIEDIGFNLKDLHVQSASFTVDFNRREIIGIGHKLPVDKPIKYPIKVGANFTALVASSKTGELRNLFFNDYKYDIFFKARNTSPWIVCTGVIDPSVVLQYDLYQCDVDSISLGAVVNERAELTMEFSTDVADTVSGKGLFISGRTIESGATFSGYNF